MALAFVDRWALGVVRPGVSRRAAPIDQPAGGGRGAAGGPYRGRMFILELEFDGDERRLAARPAHRERLLALHASGRLVLAGPWEDDSGAVLVFNTDRTGLDHALAADPPVVSPSRPERGIASSRRATRNSNL